MTRGPVSDTAAMIAGMEPRLVDGAVAFVSAKDPPAADIARRAIATFRETEGLTMILPVTDLPEGTDHVPMRQITLTVLSSLEGVGLTAAVAGALAAAGIPCNMVAAFHHDHVFVPADQADAALACLLELQQGAAS